MSYANKQHLLDLGHRAVEHFKAEAYDNPDVTNDFERMFSLKITHLYLGIGLFGNFLGHKISDADLRQAKYLLTRIETNDEQWGRLEVRWKWFYYIAKARVYFLENDIHGAVENAKKALSCAKEGRYVEEVKCTKKTLSYIESFTSVSHRLYLRNYSVMDAQNFFVSMYFVIFLLIMLSVAFCFGIT